MPLCLGLEFRHRFEYGSQLVLGQAGSMNLLSLLSVHKAFSMLCAEEILKPFLRIGGQDLTKMR